MSEQRRLLAACEWIFGGRPLTRVIGTLASLEYDAIEAIGEPERKDAGRLDRLVSRSGLRVSGLTASADRAERDLAHPDLELRRAAVAYYRGCVDLAVRLGASVVGVVPSAEGRLAPIARYEREWRLAVAAAREVAVYAGEHEVGLAIEPLNRYESFLVNRLEQAAAFASDVGIAGVGVVADLFHMNIEESDPAGVLENVSAPLMEVHLADSNRRGLGRGHLSLAEIGRALAGRNFAGTFVVECMPSSPDPFTVSDTAASRRELDGFLASTAVIARDLLSVDDRQSVESA